MNWYQVVAIILMTIPVAVHGVNHGDYTHNKFNFWGRLLNVSLWAGVLYAGGFWS